MDYSFVVGYGNIEGGDIAGNCGGMGWVNATTVAKIVIK
jgi:hypothetical protein